MRKLFLLASILMSVMSIWAQANKNSDGVSGKPSVVFSGKVTGIENTVQYSEEIPRADRIVIKIDGSLKNTGSVPIIFLGIKSGSLASIWEMADDGETHGLLYEPDHFSSSFATKKSEWEKFKNRLDKPHPPEKILIILKPGEIYNFKDVAYLRLARYPESISSELSANSRLEYLQKLSPLWLKLGKETWDKQPLLVGKNKVDSNEKRNFLTRLQKRWSRDGYLWIDDLTSEPIALDLRSVTIKTQPEK